MEDHLTALEARISPLKTIGTDLLTAGIRVYNSLWPDCEAPASVTELSKCLLATEERLREWRSSSARAGADQALTFVLSWYEEIDLNVLQSLRSDSKWTSDSALIQRRKDAAFSMASYAETLNFIAGPVYSDGEDEEDDDEATESDEETETEAQPTANVEATGTIEQAATDIPDTSAANPTTETTPTDPSSSRPAA